MRESDYVFASARTRAKENTLISRESFFRMADARSGADVLSILAECGFSTVYTEDGTHADEEGTLALLTADARALLEEAAPDPRVFDFLYYPIDCHNAKSILKAILSGQSAEDILLQGGTVNARFLLRELSEGRADTLSTHMQEASLLLRELYAKNKDPREIDLCLDRACFLDMKACASADEYLARYVSMRIDLTNFLTYLRISRRLRQDADAIAVARAEALLRQAFLPGGTVAIEDFPSLGDESFERLAEAMRSRAYASLFEKADMAAEETDKIEAYFDLYLLRSFEGIRYIPFGSCILLSYAVKREFEVKNIRMILAGKRSGMSAERIRENLRLL